jgi:hypothetical protein
MEATVQALLAAVDDTRVKFQTCDISIEIQPLNLRKAFGFDSIPNECLRHLPRDHILIYLITGHPALPAQPKDHVCKEALVEMTLGRSPIHIWVLVAEITDKFKSNYQSTPCD